MMLIHSFSDAQCTVWETITSQVPGTECKVVVGSLINAGVSEEAMSPTAKIRDEASQLLSWSVCSASREEN